MTIKFMGFQGHQHEYATIQYQQAHVSASKGLTVDGLPATAVSQTWPALSYHNSRPAQQEQAVDMFIDINVLTSKVK